MSSAALEPESPGVSVTAAPVVRRRSETSNATLTYTIEMELEVTYAELEELVETINDNGMSFRVAFAEELEYQLTGDITDEDGIPSSTLQVEAETLYLQTGEENSMVLTVDTQPATLEEDEHAFFDNYPLVVCIMLFLMLIGVFLGLAIAKFLCKEDSSRDEKMANEIVRKLSTELERRDSGAEGPTQGGPSV